MLCCNVTQSKTHPNTVDAHVAVPVAESVEIVSNDLITVSNPDGQQSMPSDDTISLDVPPRTRSDRNDYLPRYMRTLRSGSGDEPKKPINSLAVIEPSSCGRTLEISGVQAPQHKIFIVTAGEDGLARLWGFYNGQLLKTFRSKCYKPEKPDQYISIAAAEFGDSFVVVAGDDKGRAFVWDIEKGEELFSMEGIHSNGITAIQLVYCKNNFLCTMSSRDKSSSVWDMNRRIPLFKFSDKAHYDVINSLTYFTAVTSHQPSISDLTFITSSVDKTVQFWELPSLDDPTKRETISWPRDNTGGGNTADVTGAGNNNSLSVKVLLPHRMFKTHTKSVLAVAAHHVTVTDRSGGLRSYSIMVTSSLDKTAIIWDFSLKEKIHVLTGHKEKVTSVAIYAGQNTNQPVVLTASDDKTIRLWDVMTGECFRTLQYTSKISSIAVLQRPTGIVVISGGADGLPTTWDLSRSERIRKLTTGPVTGIGMYDSREGDAEVRTKAIIADVACMATVFDMHTQERLQAIMAHSSRLNSLVVYSPRDPSIPAVFVTGSADSLIKVWDMQTYALRSTLRGHTELVFALVIYDPQKCHEQISHHRELAEPLIISGGLDKSIRFWRFSQIGDQDTNTDFIANAHSSLIRALAIYHPQTPGEDPLVISGSYDRTAKIWNLRTRQELLVLKGHVDNVFLISIYDPIVHHASVDEARKKDLVPLVVTGSVDSTCIVWNLRTGENLRTLSGHSESVTAMDLYTPRDPDQPPLLITGSIDRLVMIWNIWTGERVHTLTGHSDRVCWITVYQPTAKDTPPFVLSGGDDTTTIIWEDALYSMPFMPLSDAITRTFHADLSTNDWPLLTEFVSRHGSALFFENSHLFFLAIKYQRPDFVLKFRQYLSRCLRHTKEWNGKTLLEFALECSDLISLRAVLLCWIENLNTDIKDLLHQNVFHASYFFLSLRELVPLSERYPLEYIQFISSIRLVRDHPALLEKVTELRLDPSERYEIAGSNDRAPRFRDLWYERFHRIGWLEFLVDFWYLLISRVQSMKQPVTSLFLPLCNPTELADGFGAFTAVSDQLQNVDIFNSPVGIYTVTYFWQLHGKRYHVWSLVRYLSMLALFILCVYSYQFYYHKGRSVWQDVLMNALLVVVDLLFCYYSWEEFCQIREMNKKLHWKIILAHFLRDLWNVLDICIPLTGIVGLTMVLVTQELSPTTRCFLATCSIFMWFKLLYFMRPFQSSGPLVVMILRIAYDIRFFLFVLFCVLCGFAQGFWLLSNVDEDLAFGTVRGSLLTTFMYMLGQEVTSDFEGTVSPGFATFILVCFLIFMMILMLNLLIALMGDTFSEVRSKGQALWREEQTAIISEQSFLMTDTNTHSFLHVLKYTSDLTAGANEAEVQLQQSVQDCFQHVTPFTPLKTESNGES